MEGDMVFSSLLFLFQFMPVFFLLYYLIPTRFRNVFLLIASLFFYGWGEPRFLILILFSILINYILGRGIESCYERVYKRKALFFISILYNFGMLIFFKYMNFIIENINSIFQQNIELLDITLPLGISFYTFQIMSYVTDVYRKKTRAEHSIINLGAYLCMFPQLIAGPIVVYTQVNEQLQNRPYTWKRCEEGLKIFVLGLGAKVLIANNIGALWTELGTLGYEQLSTPLAWMGIFAFALQIYFDFNGYSLMAIGLGKMMGFDFPQNFNYPYISKSITEFWRRWHITLSSWFRDYVYIPLGGNRKGKVRMYLNLLCVWAITGLWHGAGWNFILWGIYFFIFLAIEKLFLKKWLDKSKIVSHLYAIIVITISWLIFSLTNMSDIMIYLKRMFTLHLSDQWLYYGRNYIFIFLVAILLSTPLLEKYYNKIKNGFLGNLILILIFVMSVAYLVDAAYNPFLYFRF